MKLRSVVLCFIAGCLGGVAMNALNIAFGLVNFPEMIGIDVGQDADIQTLYWDIFNGGLWGLLFLIPLLNNLPLLKGVLLGVIPALAQLFIFIPIAEGSEILAVEFGLMMPVYVLLLNIVWGITASIFLITSRKPRN